ncbi:MAG: class I adenylate-forming enzyme family protein [Microthrixaceae bacterium]
MTPAERLVRTSRAPLSDAVRIAAATHGDREAICTSSGTTTWAGIDREADELLVALRSLGVGDGSTIALVMHSAPPWLVAATALNRAGATIAGISPVLPPAQRAAMVETVDADLVLADRDLLEGLPLRSRVAVLGPSGMDLGDTAARARARSAAGDREEPHYAICFTSGTTGTPRAALFDAAAARAVARIDLGDEPPLGAGGHMISSTQFAHVGFVLKVPGHAMLGMTIHVMDRWSASGAIELVQAHSIRTLGVVAPQLAAMLRSPALEGADLSSLHTVVAGGAPSPEALVAEARERLGVTYSIRWSSTESGGVGLAADVDDDHPDLVGTIGRPRPGVQARVATLSGEEASRGEVGELQIRSGATMLGYLGDPEATAEAFTSDGWLRTGDLARRREDGCFVLSGRRSEMYIRGGYNVHPQEVEAVLGTHPAVQQVAVVPRTDPVMGQVGVAVVVARDPIAAPTLEDLRAHASELLARHQLPEDLVVRASLPLAAGGKLDRRALAAELDPSASGAARGAGR